MNIAEVAVKSKLLPAAITTKEQAFIIGLKGLELGLSFMAAANYINVIKGKPCISAEGMLALIYRAHPQAKIDFKSLTETKCEIEAARPEGKPSVFSFTIEDARRAQLLSNPSWTKYPKDMLKARCISQMARSLFPDVLLGASYTPEEILSTEESKEAPRPKEKTVEANGVLKTLPGPEVVPVKDYDDIPWGEPDAPADELPPFDDEPTFEIPKAIPNLAPQSKEEAKNAETGPARALIDLAKDRKIPSIEVTRAIQKLTKKTRSTELTAPEIMKVVRHLEIEYPARV